MKKRGLPRQPPKIRRTRKAVDANEMELLIGKVADAANYPAELIQKEYNELSRCSYIGYLVYKWLLSEHGYLTSATPAEEVE